MSEGHFFVFEGIDGVGKTTQRQRFVAWLEGKSYSVVTCRDPGETKLGESLRKLLLHADQTPISSQAEMLLYLAARAQLVHEVIAPARRTGHTVVSDRFHLSTLAYQVHARGWDVEAVRPVVTFANGGCRPDLVFLLDMDPAAAAARRHGPDDRIEARGLEYLQKVRAGFLAEAERDPDHVAIIDASGTEEEVWSSVVEAVQRVLSPRPEGQR